MPLSASSLFAFFRLEELWPFAIIGPCVAGAAGVFLLLPRPQGNRTALVGALLVGLAVLAGAIMLVRTRVFSAETVLFYTFSALAIGSGVLLVTQRNPARAALSFALVVLSTCGLFLLLAAPFLMAATIIIYAGAIIVTFLFVLMLASQAGITDADARTREPLLATALGFLLLGCLVYVLQLSYEKNETAQVLQTQLAHVHREKLRLSNDNLAKLENLPLEVKDELRKAAAAHVNGGGKAELELTVIKQIEDLQAEWPDTRTADVEKMRDALTKLEAPLERGLQQHGWLPPPVAAKELASDLSGPPAAVHHADRNVEWRYDAQGRPYLPADNSSYLGRSLFTDFLLPVELGGVLLLVATIGAIAIAHRRAAPARPS